ncbi:MAG: OmpH family outer membrane protein [Planctomycetota bacterium]
MRQTAIIFVLLVALAGSVFADRTSSDPMEGVRYVDVQRVLVEWESLQAEGSAISAKYKAQFEEFNQIRTNLDSARADMSLLDETSDEYRQKGFQIKLGEESLRQRAEWSRQNLNFEQTSALERAMRQIHQAVIQLGDREGYSSILMAPTELPQLGNKINANDVLNDLNSRWVMWRNPSYDVTDQILLLVQQK